MIVNKIAKIIPLSRPWTKKAGGDRVPARALSKQENAFRYTLDLLMEDFGKKHHPQYCAICEPMKVLGKHRDEVIVDFNFSLFTTFFPSFESYVSDLRETLLQKLLSRQGGVSRQSIKERLQGLIQQQIKEDVESFLEDILKHLRKYAHAEMEISRKKKIISKVLARLKSEWISLP